jgi:hypothetical protein
MKTDDYKQELRLSATLRRTNAKKIFFAFTKISKLPEMKFCNFVLPAEDEEGVASIASRFRKSGPSLEEPLRFLTIFFSELVGISIQQLRSDLLDGKSCQPGLASSGASAELRFHVIDAV